MIVDTEYNDSLNVDVDSDNSLVEQNTLSSVFTPEQDTLPFSQGRQRQVKTSYKYAWKLLVLVSIF